VSAPDVLTGEIVDPLTDKEFAQRDELEVVIARGFGSFIEVGEALMAIRDLRLYRDQHSSFVAYLERQWQISESRAYQLINAAVVTIEVSTVVEEAPDGSPLRDTPLPQNEAQARELTGYIGRPELAAEVLREAEQDGVPTASKIKAAVKRRSPKKTKTETVQTVTEDEAEAPGPAPQRERSPREVEMAKKVHQAAANFAQYRPEQADERTVRLLEAWCRRWRETQ
jgi:hypothetical protein